MSRAEDLTLLQRAWLVLPLVLAFAAAFPFALFFITLVARYWTYFDMGINNAANGLVLFLFYGPGALLLLLLAATGVVIALRRRGVGGWLTLLAALAAMALSVTALFTAEAHRTRDYPGPRQEKSMHEFIAWFVRSWFVAEPTRPNQAMQLTASKPDVHAWSVCRRPRMLRAMRRGLAAADLVSR